MTAIEYTRPRLTSYQTAIIDSPARFTITEASTKSGKTVSHIVWLFEEALKRDRGQFVWWVAPVYQQTEIAYRRMKAFIQPRELYNSNDGKMRLTLVTGAVIEFKSAQNYDNLYGEDVYAAVFDEATRAKEEAWFALRSTLTATNGKCKIIGNVKGKKNWVYRLGQRARAGEPNYQYFKITVLDSIREGILTQEEMEQAKRDLPEDVFNELYMAIPTEDGSNPFGFEHIARNTLPRMADGVPVCFGIDLAKTLDWTVIIGLNENGEVCHFERFQKDWKQTREHIVRTVGNTFTIIDKTGVGDPVVEDIQRVCHQVQGFQFTPSTKQNVIEELVMAIQHDRVKFPEGVIREELESFEYNYTGMAVRYSAPVGMHDDCVCALALAVRGLQERKTSRVYVH